MKRTNLVVLIDERDAAEELYERLSGISGRGVDVVLRRGSRAAIRLLEKAGAENVSSWRRQAGRRAKLLVEPLHSSGVVRPGHRHRLQIYLAQLPVLRQIVAAGFFRRVHFGQGLGRTAISHDGASEVPDRVGSLCAFRGRINCGGEVCSGCPRVGDGALLTKAPLVRRSLLSIEVEPCRHPPTRSRAGCAT